MEPIQRRAARLVVLDPEDRILLFRIRDPRDGQYFWLTPGGGLNPGEAVEEGARRELFEETGLRDVDLSGPIWHGRRLFLFQGQEYDQDETFFLARVGTFAVDVSGGEVYELDMEHRWWTREELSLTAEPVYPRGLAGLLADVLEQGVPDRPIAING